MRAEERAIREKLAITKYIVKQTNDESGCNICHGPLTITFLEPLPEDEVRGNGPKDRVATERIPCLGHDGILPHLWNLHPEHNRFQEASLAKLRMQLGKTATPQK